MAYRLTRLGWLVQSDPPAARDAIVAALTRADGRIARACLDLDIGRDALGRYLRALDRVGVGVPARAFRAGVEGATARRGRPPERSRAA